MSGPEPVPLDLLPPAVVGRRARGVAVLAAVLAAAAGGVVGLVGGRVAGLLAAAVVGVPLLLLALAEARRRTWLQGPVVAVRALGVRRIDLNRATHKDLLVSEVRGQRTVSLLLSEPGGPTVTVALALYTAAGGVELGVLALRRLADALAGCGDAAASMLSALLVAQLRAEARGEALPDRPLHLAAGLVEAGRVLRKVNPARLAALVAECS
ncbi:MAG TPA: hypothetical protein VGJ95_01135 [Pseudonocardiaceae bacterium]|jgi:hypothetical protein